MSRAPRTKFEGKRWVKVVTVDNVQYVVTMLRDGPIVDGMALSIMAPTYEMAEAHGIELREGAPAIHVHGVSRFTACGDVLFDAMTEPRIKQIVTDQILPSLKAQYEVQANG